MVFALQWPSRCEVAVWGLSNKAETDKGQSTDEYKVALQTASTAGKKLKLPVSRNSRQALGSWSTTKLSERFLKQMHGTQYEELTLWS